jgi:hypothetical protein
VPRRGALARIHVLDHALAKGLVERVDMTNASLAEVVTSIFRKAFFDRSSTVGGGDRAILAAN